MSDDDSKSKDIHKDIHKSIFNPLLNRQMTRKQFMVFVGSSLVAVFGITEVIKRLKPSLAEETPTSSQVFDVTDYGADPTGASDSTSAIQSAINAASSSGVIGGPGGIVFFPANPATAGACYLFSTLAVPNDVGLIGSGWVQAAGGFFGASSNYPSNGSGYGSPYKTNGSILKSTATSGVAIAVSGSIDSSTNNRTGGFYIKDLLLLGPGTGTSTGIGIGGIGNSSAFNVYGRVDNVEVCNFSTGWSLWGVENSTIIQWAALGCQTGMLLQSGSNANVYMTTGISYNNGVAISDNNSESSKWLNIVMQGCQGKAYMEVTNTACCSYEQIYAGKFFTATTAFTPPTTTIIHNSGNNNEYKNFVGGDTTDTSIALNGGYENTFNNFQSNAGSTVATVASGLWARFENMDGGFGSVTGAGKEGCLVIDQTNGIYSPAGFFGPSTGSGGTSSSFG
jgi:hypothetical protein